VRFDSFQNQGLIANALAFVSGTFMFHRIVFDLNSPHCLIMDRSIDFLLSMPSPLMMTLFHVYSEISFAFFHIDRKRFFIKLRCGRMLSLNTTIFAVKEFNMSFYFLQ